MMARRRAGCGSGRTSGGGRPTRDATVRLVREVAGLGDTDRLPSALESRGLPEELESGESGAAKRARLLASLFEHPA